jgi:hypothetical protein
MHEVKAIGFNRSWSNLRKAYAGSRTNCIRRFSIIQDSRQLCRRIAMSLWG